MLVTNHLRGTLPARWQLLVPTQIHLLLRVGAQRALAQATRRGIGAVVPGGGDDLVGSGAILAPSHQGQEGVVLGIGEAGNRVDVSAKDAGLVATGEVPGGVDGGAADVLHAGDEEVAEPALLGGHAAQGAGDGGVEVVGGAGGDEAVGVAVVLEELAAAVPV